MRWQRFIFGFALAVLLFSRLAAPPALGPALAASVTLNVAQDTNIVSGSSSPAGSDDYVAVGYDGQFGVVRGLLQFDLSTIPVGAQIEFAELDMYYAWPGLSGVDQQMTLSIRRLTRAWDEGSAVWSNMGDASAAAVYSSIVLPGGSGAAEQWYSWDITSLVQDWVSGAAPNYGLAVHGSEGAPVAVRSFASKEMSGGLGSRLVVQWTAVSPTPSPTSTATPTETGTPTASPTSVISGLEPATVAAPATLPPLDDGSGNDVSGEAVTPAPTRSAFPFTSSAVRYQANDNAQGCQWLSIAGTVAGLDGDPLPGIAIEIDGENYRSVVFSGSAPDWGEAGFEFELGSAPRAATYRLRALGPTGGPVSDDLFIETGSTCQRNVAVVEFVQNHAY